jgi:ribosomal protein S18 acetylase RimI-like enzyme
MKISRLKNEHIFDIRSLWEDQKNLHSQLSTYFGEEIRDFTFEERLAQFEDRDALAVFIAQTETELIGYCIASVKGKTGEVDSIYIKPNHRRQKIGERLMNEAESWLRTKNISEIIIRVGEGNESVFGFYHQRGFRPRYTVFEKIDNWSKK